MNFYLGVDVGGSKTEALIASTDGKALSIGVSGSGNYEVVGWDGFKNSVDNAVKHALAKTNFELNDISGIGVGISGYDWPSQKQDHLSALAEIGLAKNIEIVNDAILGIVAGAKDGWGISVVSGSGCNCRGWNRDHNQEGRVVGGASYWSGEYAGGYDILAKAVMTVAFEWTMRGPPTKLTDMFIELAGASDLDDLMEGLYLGRYDLVDPENVIRVFNLAKDGDQGAISVLKWAGEELGKMACGVIRQLNFQEKSFDVVMIGSIFKGGPIIKKALAETIHRIAGSARLIHLNVPPVVGAVLLGMECAGKQWFSIRQELIGSTKRLASTNDG